MLRQQSAQKSRIADQSDPAKEVHDHSEERVRVPLRWRGTRSHAQSSSESRRVEMKARRHANEAGMERRRRVKRVNESWEHEAQTRMMRMTMMLKTMRITNAPMRMRRPMTRHGHAHANYEQADVKRATRTRWKRSLRM